MDVVTIIIGVIAGAVGGWLISVVAKNMSMGTVGDLIVGLIGGVVLVWVAVTMGWSNWGVPYVGPIVLGVLGGLVLAAIAGGIRKATMKA